MKVLVVEDDAHIRAGLIDILEDEGYETLSAASGEEALGMWRTHSPDFICLDIMMPGQSGYDVCREIRKRDQKLPIIFISAKSEEIDKVLGLELGADDYIMKPFGVREVVARIRAITRRARRFRELSAGDESFSMGELVVYPAQLRATRGERTVDLSVRDLKILELLFRRKGQAVDRDTFFRECWGVKHIPNSRTLDQHISQLRKRVEADPHAPRIIQTVHGVGYRFDG